MEKKITKRENFEMVKVIVENSNVTNKVALIDFINHELELLERKANTKSNILTPTQKENIKLLDIIKNTLNTLCKPVTITELQNECEELQNYSNQKVSALLKKLVDNQEITKIIDKKKAYFSAKKEV